MDWNLLDAMRFLGECLLMLAATALVMGLIGLINGGRRGACGQTDRNTRFSGFRVTEFRLARVASAEISASRLTANSGCHRWALRHREHHRNPSWYRTTCMSALCHKRTSFTRVCGP